MHAKENVMSHCSIFIAAFEGEIAGPIFKNICPHHVQIGSGGPGRFQYGQLKHFLFDPKKD